MSYISFDYKCKECGEIEARMVKRDVMDWQKCMCRPQGTLMYKMPPATRTTFRFADRKLK